VDFTRGNKRGVGFTRRNKREWTLQGGIRGSGLYKGE